MKLAELKAEIRDELAFLYQERELNQLINQLIESILGMNRADAVLNAGSDLDEDKLRELRKIKDQLKKGRPLEYILQESYFFGRAFFVDERVLVPRPETEELVQLILERETDQSSTVLDIGTGSACIPIILKLEGNYHSVDGCEVSVEALEVAAKNARELKAEIDLFQMDILEEIPTEQYDIIVSNPPYVFQEELEHLDARVVEHEPIIALTPPADPLQFYRRILDILPKCLKKGGRLYFEIHEEMGDKMEVLMLHYGLKEVAVIEDMYGRDRFALGIYEA